MELTALPFLLPRGWDSTSDLCLPLLTPPSGPPGHSAASLNVTTFPLALPAGGAFLTLAQLHLNLSGQISKISEASASNHH